MDDDKVIDDGRAALAELYAAGGSQDWRAWVKVGAALKLGRDECVRAARSNGPFGKRYRNAFKEWLEENGFAARPDAPMRSKLIEVMERLDDIEYWRANILTDRERARLNNPEAVLRRFKKDQLVQAGHRARPEAAERMENMARAMGQAFEHARKVWPDDATMTEKVTALAEMHDWTEAEVWEFGHACLAFRQCSDSSENTNTAPQVVEEITGENDHD